MNSSVAKTHPMWDVVVLTEARYLVEEKDDWYSRQLHAEDRYVVEALQALGLRVIRRDWADPANTSGDAQSLLFRSTWDYFDRFATFSPWLEQVSQQCQLFNPAPLLRWNVDKHYLAYLQTAGVRIVPTHIIEVGDPHTLADQLALFDDEQWILKPAVSGAARHTYRFHRQQVADYQAIYAELIAHESLLLQPFQHAITEQGELSIIVIDGKVTHAIRKTAKAGDFRVQDDHGGTVHPHEATAEEIAFAQAAVAAVPFDVVYARVDVIRDNHGQLAVMELEMVEPELFFRYCPAAAEHLARAVHRRLQAM